MAVAQRVDGNGRFLIPGLWDLHVHPDDPEVWQLAPTREEKQRFLELFVEVTTPAQRERVMEALAGALRVAPSPAGA